MKDLYVVVVTHPDSSSWVNDDAFFESRFDAEEAAKLYQDIAKHSYADYNKYRVAKLTFLD